MKDCSVEPPTTMREPSPRRAVDGYLPQSVSARRPDGHDEPSLGGERVSLDVVHNIAVVVVVARHELSNRHEPVPDVIRVSLHRKKLVPLVDRGRTRRTSSCCPPKLTSVPSEVHPPPALHKSASAVHENSDRTRTSWSSCSTDGPPASK